MMRRIVLMLFAICLIFVGCKKKTTRNVVEDFAGGSAVGEEKEKNKNKKIYSELTTKVNNAKSILEYGLNTDYNDYDTITFGKYPQNSTDIDDKQDVEWIVLEKEDNRALLLSKYILDCKCFNNEYIKTSWGTSSLRKWLNSEFYNNAFSDDEKAQVVSTEVINYDNTQFGTGSGNVTNDNVFLLSANECRNYFGYEDVDFVNKSIITNSTEYAKNQVNFDKYISVQDGADWNKGCSPYWLRTTGHFEDTASQVTIGGYLDQVGSYVRDPQIGIRPCIYVKIDYDPDAVRVGGIEGTVMALDNGNIQDAYMANNATVEFYNMNNENECVARTTSHNNGKYRMYLPYGQYKVVITSPNHAKMELYQNITDRSLSYVEQSTLFLEGENGLGKSGGKIVDAFTGKTVEGVELKLRKNWNTTEGEYVEGARCYTNSEGQYVVENVPVGYYTLEAKKDGYITINHNIMVISSNSIFNFDFPINPIMEDDGSIRIVLSWGLMPQDLDSHMIGKNNNGYLDVYFSNKSYAENGKEIVNLDVDDTNGEGPETITVKKLNKSYVYGIHDYSNQDDEFSNALSYSNAKVVLYQGNRQIGTYYVPTGKVGTFWEVLSIDKNGYVNKINKIYNYNPNNKMYDGLLFQ